MTKQTKSRRIGRPKVKPTPGERASLGLRVTAKMKRRLDAAAESSGRSQSQEAEIRLERSFDQDDAFGGPELRQIAYLMAAAFARAGQHSAGSKPASEWVKDPDAFRAAILGTVNALLIGRGEEEIKLICEGFKGTVLARLANLGESK